MSSSPKQKGNISDLRAQLKEQRVKRIAAARRLREATADAAEGTPADSKFFRLDQKAPNGNGYASAEETQEIAGLLPELDEKENLRKARLAARLARKNRLDTLKKTTFEVIAHCDSKRYKKKKI